jgi:hypothetical protein
MTTTNYLLLIWQIIPEDIQLYLIPFSEIDNDEFSVYFEKTDHKYTGLENSCEVDDALNWVSNWLETNGENYKVSKTEPFRITKFQHISEVITSGFLL